MNEVTIAIGDPLLADVLADNLAADGHEIDRTRTLDNDAPPSVWVIDQLNNGGAQLIREVTAAGYGALGIARSPDEAIRALEAGGDAIAHPFNYQELRARIRKLARRGGAEGPARIVAGLELDAHRRLVAVDGAPVELTRKEFDLLVLLASEPTRIWTKQEILKRVWGWGQPGATRTLDSHACRLRQKLRAAGAGDGVVQNVWAVGYRLVAPA